jgi:hypothetical protein
MFAPVTFPVRSFRHLFFIVMSDLKASWQQLDPWYQSVLIGAGVTTVLSSSYIGITYCCCFGVIGGSLLASQQYASRTGSIEGRDGISLGVVSALLGGILVTIVEWMGQFTGIGAAGIQHMVPAWSGIEDQMQGWDIAMGVLWTAFAAIVRMLVYPLLGLIGGVLGAVLFGEG